MNATAAQRALTRTFVEVTRELAAECVRAEAYLTEGPYRTRHLEQHVQKVDATLRKHYPEIYQKIGRVMSEEYHDAMVKATQFTGIPHDAPRELDVLIIETQREVLENEITAALIKSGETAKRIVGSAHLGREQRLELERVFMRHTLRGDSTQELAREVFTALNATGGFDPKTPWANAVNGKLIQINGKNYNLAAYSDLVAQHRVSQLSNAADVAQAAQDGFDLMQVDDHNTTAEVCRPFEGTIWSISGTSRKYKPLSACPGSGIGGGPPFHPRCSHFLMPVVKRVAEYAERQYQATRATEAMERRWAGYRAKSPPAMNRNIVAVEELEQIVGGSDVAGSMLKPVLETIREPYVRFADEMAARPLGSRYTRAQKEMQNHGARLYMGRVSPERAKALGTAGTDVFAMPDVVGNVAQHAEPGILDLNKLTETLTDGELYRDTRTGHTVARLPVNAEYEYMLVFEDGQAVTFFKVELNEMSKRNVK